MDEAPDPGFGAGDARLRRAPAALWRSSLGALVLLAGDGPRDPAVPARPLVIEGSAGEVWAELREPRTRAELGAVLGERHGIDPAVIVADLAPVLERLIAEGLVEEVPGILA